MVNGKKEVNSIRSPILAGIVAGLLAGIAFGLWMQNMRAPKPDGGTMPMMVMVAMVVRSQDLVVGWLYHLFNNIVIGAIFGALVADRVRGYAAGLVLGALYGVFWWVLGAQILMPLLLGMAPFPLLMPMMQAMAISSLLGHLMYGLILGGRYIVLRRAAVQPAEPVQPVERAARHAPR